MKFECEGGPKSDIDICIDVDTVLVHCGEERAQCKREAVRFPVHLQYIMSINCHELWLITKRLMLPIQVT